MYDDIELFQRFQFPRCELLEVINNFKDDITLKLKPFFFFSPTLSMVRGTLPVVFKASVMFAPRWLSCTALVCFDGSRVLLSAQLHLGENYSAILSVMAFS